MYTIVLECDLKVEKWEPRTWRGLGPAEYRTKFCWQNLLSGTSGVDVAMEHEVGGGGGVCGVSEL